MQGEALFTVQVKNMTSDTYTIKDLETEAKKERESENKSINEARHN